MRVKSFSRGNLRVDVDQSDTEVQIRWSGSIDEEHLDEHQDVADLHAFLEQALPAQPASVVIDFTAVEHLSPQAAGPIVLFLRKMKANAVATTVVFDPEHGFQRLAFADLVDSLAHFPNVSVRHARSAPED